jgi:hypothetical protein
MKPTKEDILQAILKFPMPKITNWYLNNFPKKTFWIIEAFAFATGLVSTIFKSKKVITGMATLIFVVILAIAGFIHTLSWIKMRIVEKRRAKYLGISLQEYWDYIDLKYRKFKGK